MHASGQWSALGTLLGGGKVVLYDEPHVDMEHVLDLVERERVNAMQPRRRRERAPAARTRSPRSRGRWDTLVAAAARFGRQHPVGRREGRR